MPSADIASTAKKDPPKGSSKRVLIIEDEKPLAHALELKMKHEGYAVITKLTDLTRATDIPSVTPCAGSFCRLCRDRR
jgi:hypothetical protein